MSDVFQARDSSLFDDVLHTQGGLPHLIQHLWDAYCVRLNEQINLRQEAGKPAVSLEEAKKRAPAVHFAEWCAEYLKQHRPVGTTFVDANIGLRLSNNDLVVVSPGVEIRGTMQDAGAIEVTHGRSQEGNEGVVSSKSLRI